MISPEIIQFINNAISKGATPEQITTTLMQKGWKQDEIVEALKTIENSKNKPTNSLPTNVRQYPHITIEKIENPNRFYAFPILGGLYKFIILIPVFIEFYIFNLIWPILLLLNSFVVLFTGKKWKIAFDIGAGIVNLDVKINFYLNGITDKYPGFKFTIEDNYTVDIPYIESSNRLFAIPFLGGIIRYFATIPIVIFYYILNVTTQLITGFSSFVVLFTGRYPESTFELVRDTTRMLMGATMYLSGMSDTYPSFKISMNHKVLKLGFIIITTCYIIGSFIVTYIAPGLYYVPLTRGVYSQKNFPSMYTIPSTHIVNPSYKPDKVTKLYHYGITLSSPWGAPKNVGNFSDTTILYTFDNNKGIAISAINAPSIVRISKLTASQKKELEKYGSALKKDLTSSDYALYSNIYSVTPNDISMSTSTDKIGVIFSLLSFKGIIVSGNSLQGNIYKLNDAKGYQFYTKTKDGYVAVVNVFDQENNARMVLITGNPTQDEVDFIASTIKIDSSQNQIQSNGKTTYDIKTSNCQLANFSPITAAPNADFTASLGPCDQKLKDALNASENAWVASNLPLMKQFADTALSVASNDIQKGVAHYWIGLYYHTARDNQSAINEFLKSIQLSPQLANSYSAISADYNSLKDYNNALLYGKKCVELDSLYAYCHSNYGVALNATGNPTEGLKEIQQAISLQPSNQNIQGIYNSEKDFYSKLSPTPTPTTISKFHSTGAQVDTSGLSFQMTDAVDTGEFITTKITVKNITDKTVVPNFGLQIRSTLGAPANNISQNPASLTPQASQQFTATFKKYGTGTYNFWEVDAIKKDFLLGTFDN